jgi:hypothetical protein
VRLAACLVLAGVASPVFLFLDWADETYDRTRFRE